MRNRTNRRTFIQAAAATAALAGAISSRAQAAPSPLLLGGPVNNPGNPDGWVEQVRAKGYRAAYCPVGPEASDDVVRAYEQAAAKANITIAEVGAWSNPLSSDENERKNALDKNIKGLELADRIGARCCVNIAGARGPQWAGHDANNLTPETFDMIVEVARSIIDAVKPTRSFYTLEMMQWAYPDSPDCYLKLIRAIDRKQLAVHLDPVNIINCPSRYHSTGAIIRECFKKLGPMIRSCHAKDVIMAPAALVHLDEIIPGKGNLDYAVYLKELRRFPDVPLMMEHLKNQDEYLEAATYIRSVDAKI